MNVAEAAIAGLFGGNGSGGGSDVTKAYVDEQDAKKTDKVTSAISGNFAGLDENGNLTDSNKSAADFATASDMTAVQGVIPSTATTSNKLATASDVTGEDISSTSTTSPLTDSADGYVQGVTVKGHSEVVEGEIKSIGDAGWGVVDLGTLTWTYVSSDSIFYAGVDDGKPSINTQEGTGKGLCSVYNIVQKTYANMVDYDMLVGSRIGGTNKMYICARNTAYTDATAFKSAMSGVFLYYPLADTTGATPTFGITSKNGAGQGTAATITTGLPLRSTLDGTVYDELTNEKVITRCEVVEDEVVPLATPTETPLTSAEKSALASLRTYDHTTYIDATDAPTMTVDYLLNTNNGKAVADIQTDLQEQIDSGSFAETVLYDNMNLTVEPAVNVQLNLSQPYTNFDEIRIEYAYHSITAAANNTIYPYEYSYSVAELEAMRTSLYNGRKGYLLLDRYLNFVNMYVSLDITSTSILTINEVLKSNNQTKHYITKITGIKY